VWIAPNGQSNEFATTPFRDLHSAALARLPNVKSVGLYRSSFLDWGERRLLVRAPPSSAQHPIPPSQFLGECLTLATARVRQGNWAVFSQTLATENHLHVGERFMLPSPRPIALRIAGLTTNLGWPPGTIIINSDNYARAWASGDPSAYEIQIDAGASASTVRDLARRALGSASGLTVETSAERERRHYALAAQGLTRVSQITLLVLIAAVLAVVGAMGSMIWQRRELIASMKCHGFREGVLWRWLLCESAVPIASGCSIGAIFGLYAQLLGSHFLATVTGFPVVFRIDGVAAISSFALVSTVAVAMLALPGYLVARVPPRTVSPA
jgi:putative ABC transport system permease protein